MSVTSRCWSVGLSVNFCELSVGQLSVGEWSCYHHMNFLYAIYNFMKYGVWSLVEAHNR